MCVPMIFFFFLSEEEILKGLYKNLGFQMNFSAGI